MKGSTCYVCGITSKEVDMFARIIQKDDEVLVIGQKTAEQSASNAIRSPRVLKQYSKTVFNLDTVRRFCEKQGHTLIGGVL